jgi:hypothetical protein
VTELTIRLLRTSDGWEAIEPETSMYGEGSTQEIAVCDLLDSLRVLHEELAQRPDQLAPHLAADLAFLDEALSLRKDNE